MRDITFGNYYATNSFLHKMDARVKILLSTLYFITVFFLDSYISHIVLGLFLLSLILISKIKFLEVLKTLKPMIFLIVFTCILNIFFNKKGNTVLWEPNSRIKVTVEGLHFAVKIVLRILYLVIGTSLVTFTTTPTEITDALEYLMTPLKIFNFPVRDVAIIISIALRFIPIFIEETDKIIMAQKARGADFETGNIFKRAKMHIPILIPLFVNAFRKADELADALDSRCYNATKKRTKMKVLKISYRDIIGILVVVTICTLIMVDKFYFKNIDRIVFPNAVGMY